MSDDDVIDAEIVPNEGSSKAVVRQSEPVEIDRWGFPVVRVVPDRPTPTPPMTRPEIAAILKMTAGGHSKADPTVMDLWLQCAHSARWTYVEAHAAVIVHMTTSSDYITPAHLTAIIRATRQDTAMRETAERESVVNPDAAARVRRMCAEFGERNYSMSDDTVIHPRGLHVDCPNTVCGAKRGDPCKHPTRRVTGFVHPSRQDAEQKYIQEHK